MGKCQVAGHRAQCSGARARLQSWLARPCSGARARLQGWLARPCSGARARLQSWGWRGRLGYTGSETHRMPSVVDDSVYIRRNWRTRSARKSKSTRRLTKKSHPTDSKRSKMSANDRGLSRKATSASDGCGGGARTPRMCVSGRARVGGRARSARELPRTGGRVSRVGGRVGGRARVRVHPRATRMQAHRTE